MAKIEIYINGKLKGFEVVPDHDAVKTARHLERTFGIRSAKNNQDNYIRYQLTGARPKRLKPFTGDALMSEPVDQEKR
jgi:hypothetical protein